MPNIGWPRTYVPMTPGEAVDGDLYTWSGGAFLRHRSDLVFGFGALVLCETQGLCFYAGGCGGCQVFTSLADV